MLNQLTSVSLCPMETCRGMNWINVSILFYYYVFSSTYYYSILFIIIKNENNVVKGSVILTVVKAWLHL